MNTKVYNMKNKDLKRITREAVYKFLTTDMTNAVIMYFIAIADNEELDPDVTDIEIRNTINEFVTDIKEHFNIY
ncbi:MAG: hypothetical protein DRJ10_08325 [Bacteroidetes bacterium]|nr:MAG: hypothetical protein DRJ10_08325 [Bacteroidota bacterium]